MKPDWKDAPDWAQWLAIDELGEWWWFEFEPKLSSSGNAFDKVLGRVKSTGICGCCNKDSLECRP